jgi:uncharacterized membrane protein
MTICENCGKEIQEGAQFCPSCGTAAGGTGGRTTAGNPAESRTGSPAADNSKGMAIVAYILFFVPLLTGAYKESDFVKYHTNQGTVLFIAACVYGIGYSILSLILAFIPVIGWILIILLGLCSFGILALCIIGIINAVNNKCAPLPFIGKFTIVK